MEHDHATQIQVAPSLSIDEMIEQSIGRRINTTQVLQAILASLPPFLDSQQTYMSNFAHAQPSWHCTSNNQTSCNNNTTNLCTIPRNNWAWNNNNVHTSIISEWHLECANTLIVGLPTTCYFVGCFLGGLLLATLGDSSLGRKKVLCASSLVMSLAALVSAFSPNIWVYSIFRFISGIGRAPLTICALVLLTERVNKRWRSHAAMVGFIHFSLGILALTVIAYLTRGSSWRNLYLWTSIPGIVCSLICYFFLFESPRWLFMQGRDKESIEILRKLGQHESSSNQIHSITPITTPSPPPTTTTINTNNNNNNNGSLLSSLKTLIQKRWAIQRLLVSMILAFGIGLMYFGMFLGVGNLGFNIYLTSTISALLSLVSYLLTFLFWIQRCNRRNSLLGFCVISGATSLIFSIVGKHNNDSHHKVSFIIIGLMLVSLFCACMAYNLVLMYMIELFPTCVRNLASSLVRQAMILGSVFDPMLVLIGRKNLIYSYGVFGTTMFLCGFLVLLLPETRGKVLCDTMEEQEIRDNGSRLC